MTSEDCEDHVETLRDTDELLSQHYSEIVDSMLVEPDKDLLAKIAELVEGVDTSMWWYPWLIRRHRYLRRTGYRRKP